MVMLWPARSRNGSSAGTTRRSPSHQDGRRLRQGPALRVGLLDGDHQRAASAHDDVLHLDPMEVEGRLLPLAYDQELLGIGPLVGAALDPVAEAEEQETPLGKIARAEIGDVPAHLVLAAIGRQIRVGPANPPASTSPTAAAATDARRDRPPPRG